MLLKISSNTIIVNSNILHKLTISVSPSLCRNLSNCVAETDPGPPRRRRHPADERGVDRCEAHRVRGLCAQAVLQLTGDASKDVDHKGGKRRRGHHNNNIIEGTKQNNNNNRRAREKSSQQRRSVVLGTTTSSFNTIPITTLRTTVKDVQWGSSAPVNLFFSVKRCLLSLPSGLIYYYYHHSRVRTTFLLSGLSPQLRSCPAII